MKIALLAAAVALTLVPALDARYAPSANGVDPVDSIIAPDVRLRLPNGKIRPDLSSAEDPRDALHFESPRLSDSARATPRRWGLPYPKPITPEGDGEFPAIHYAPKPDLRFPAPMPIVKGVYVPNGTLMKVPDPAVDYKLHVRDVPLPAADGSPTK